MRVIKPEPQHVHAWVELVKKFLDEGFDQYDWGFDLYSCHVTYHNWLKNQVGFLLEHEGEIVGVIAGIIAPHYFDYNTLYFYEAMWYVEESIRSRGGGIRLLHAAEQECLKRGIKKMVMAHTAEMESEFFEKAYPRLGYTYFEKHYVKDLYG